MEKQKREKRPSENRPMAGRKGQAQEKGPQKYETGERPTDGLREREIVVGGKGRTGEGGERERERRKETEVAAVGH